MMIDEEKMIQSTITIIVEDLHKLKKKDPIEYYTVLPEMKKDLGLEFFNKNIKPLLDE